MRIASQLTPEMHERIAAAVPGVEFVPVAAGFPTELPAGATVFFAMPYRNGAATFPSKAAWVDRVEWIQLLSAGADGYPDWYFEVPQVTCSRGPTARPVAEFALAAIFAHAKRLPQAWIQDAADWRPRLVDMLHGATLGIVGFGAIGQTLASLGAALGMRVLVSRRSDAPLPEGITAVPLETLLRESDHVVLAAAATVHTRHLLGRRELLQAKRGLHLVNIARGSLLDQEALLEALNAGIVACASLDVADPEPLPAGHPLYRHPQVRLSPHLSAYDPTLRARLADGFAANLQRFLAGKELAQLIDRERGY